MLASSQSSLTGDVSINQPRSCLQKGSIFIIKHHIYRPVNLKCALQKQTGEYLPSKTPGGSLYPIELESQLKAVAYSETRTCLQPAFNKSPLSTLVAHSQMCNQNIDSQILRPKGTTQIIQSDFLHNTGQRISPSDSCHGGNYSGPLLQMLLLLLLLSSETCLPHTTPCTSLYSGNLPRQQAMLLDYICLQGKETMENDSPQENSVLPTTLWGIQC